MGDKVVHRCPACGARHEIHVVLDRLACGRQLACSARCKQDMLQRAKARHLAELAERRSILSSIEAND